MPKYTQRDKFLYFFLLSVSLYLMLYFYHGFMAFGSDTIETVPYALWMANKSLFNNDFHLSNISQIFPNERWVISWLLHIFPKYIYTVSLFFHALFSIILIYGMLKLSNHVLKSIELSVLAVFLTLFSLYNINTGSNELYYNMFVASLAAKSIGVWSIYHFLQKKYLLTSFTLILSTFLHPLVGLQLFVVLLAIVLIHNVFLSNKIRWKDILIFSLLYLLTAGIWIALILGAQGQKIGDVQLFYDIVEFRIAHHFFPEYFPKSHVFIISLLSLFACIQFYNKQKHLFLFFIVSIAGIIIYMVGLFFQIEIFLSSQWMKITIWLKFFSIIAVLTFLQANFEKKHHRHLFIIGFIAAFTLAFIRFNPKFDKESPTQLYAWISMNTEQNDLFLVPPTLMDFKAKTLRSSYFDFKAMLHHRPEIYDWASRFEEVYGLQISERSIEDNIFSKVNNSYAHGKNIRSNQKIDFFILPNKDQFLAVIESFEIENQKILYIDEDYIVYGKK